jgi:hypothetical protein
MRERAPEWQDCLTPGSIIVLYINSKSKKIIMNKKKRMIEWQLKGRDIEDEKVIQAMRAVNRETFLPANMKELAYEDAPLPIGKGQTISQPYIDRQRQALNDYYLAHLSRQLSIM